MHIKRTLADNLRHASQQFPVTLVTGARQVGKTTLMRKLSDANRTYMSLDDLEFASLASHDPAQFLQRFPPPLLIDDIQYAPQLLPHISKAVKSARRNSMFWLVGSPQALQMPGVSAALDGITGFFELAGLSQKETQSQTDNAPPFLPTQEQLATRYAISPKQSARDIFHVIWRGSYPALWTSRPKADRNSFYSAYVKTCLLPEVNGLVRIADQTTFLKFLAATATRTAQLLNMSELARDAGVSVPTAKRWLDALETLGVIYLLKPCLPNTAAKPSKHTKKATKTIKTPKLYFADTGLCAYLTKWETPKALQTSVMAEAMLETFAVSEIRKSYLHNCLEPPLSYYRDTNKKEISLLIEHSGTLHPVECQATASPEQNAARQQKLLEKLGQPVAEGGTICLPAAHQPTTSQSANSTIEIPAQLL